MTQLLTDFLFAAAAGTLVVAGFRWLARQFGLVDQPDGHRKTQDKGVALGGGPAILVTVCLAQLCLPGQEIFALAQANPAFLLACTLVTGLGLFDDALHLRGRWKLSGQIVVAFLASTWLSQPLIGHVQGLAPLLTWGVVIGIAFWLVLCMNAMNLLDGIDGLAGAVSFYLFCVISVTSFITGHVDLAVFAAVFAGATAGFLVFNLPSASIYLGDAGSMLLGLTCGALAVKCCTTDSGSLSFIPALAFLTIPLFDTSFAILRRWFCGQSLFMTDRAHIHHQLKERFGLIRALVAISTASLVTSVGAGLSLIYQTPWPALGCSAIVVCLFVLSRAFGGSEARLVFWKVVSVSRAFLPQMRNRPVKPSFIECHMQGKNQWAPLLHGLVENVEKHGFQSVRMDVNLPRHHERYHAVWHNQRYAGSTGGTWRLDVPIKRQEQVVVSLRFSGPSNARFARVEAEALTELLDDFELTLDSMINKIPATSSSRQTPPSVGKPLQMNPA